MHWIIRFLFQHKNFSSLLVTVLLSLGMLTSSHEQQFAIGRALTMTIFFPLQVAIHQHTRIKNIFGENVRLKEQVAQLTVQCALQENALQENKNLKGLLGFDTSFSYSLIPSRAVAHEPSYLFRSIVINVGKKKGVSLYMPVISKDGVVGKVVQAMDYISLVHLFRDPSERMSVMFKKNRDVGILETIDGKDFYIRYRKNAPVSMGDTIVTSGLGGIYPPGLYVGTVVAVPEETADPLFKMVYLKPFVDFNRMEEVYVMKLSSKWESFKSELDSLDMTQ